MKNIVLFLLLLLATALPQNTWGGCLNITGPSAGDSWHTTSTYAIQWNTTSTMPTARIHLYKNGQRKYTITSTAPNNGSYSWAIPADTLVNKLDEGNQYYISICTDDCCGDGEYFSLYFPPPPTASYTASPTATKAGDSFWDKPLLEMLVSITGTTATYTVSRIDGSPFSSSGTMFLKVGSYETYGIVHDTKSVTANTTVSVTLTDNLDNYPESSYPKEFYARYEPNEGGWAWVGPITVSRVEDAAATGSITSPGSSAQGDITVSCNAEDPAGIEKVSVVFVSNGTPLVLCEDGTSNPCAGSSGSWTKNNVNPLDYGVTGEGAFTLGLWLRNENGDPAALVDTQTVNWSKEPPKYKLSGYTQRYNGQHIPSVTVSFSGGLSSVISDANGYYEKYVDHGWSGTVSAAKSGYRFDSDTISTVTSDRSENSLHGDYYPRTGTSASVSVKESNWSTSYSRSNSTSCSDCRKCEKNCADPIDISTGAQFLEYRLLSVQGLVPITFNLAYNSLVVDQEGIAGKAWSLNYDFAAKIQPADNEAVNVAWAENRSNRFNHDGGGMYSSLDEACIFDKLVKNADNSFTLTRQDKTVYQFDAAGRLTALRDEQGRALQFSYDSSDRLQRITEPIAGVFLEYAYNSDGLLASVTDTIGRQVSLIYDADRRLKSITDPYEHSISFTWNSQGQILTGTSSEGYQLFANTFDAQGRVAAQDDGLPDNKEATLAYDESQPDRIITTVTDRNGAVSQYTFDGQHRMLEKIDELGSRSAAYSYDAKGSRTAAVDANGHGSSFAYDAQGNMTSVTDADGKVTAMVYTAENRLAALTDALGKTSSFAYDSQGRMTRAVDPLGKAAAFSYNSAGQLLAVTTPAGRVTQYEYAGGLPTKVIRPEGTADELRYDAAGRLTAVIDGEGNTTSFAHDLPCPGPCRAASITDPLGNAVKMTYDSRGNLLSLLDAKGNESRFEYDGNGNMIRAINALGQITTYGYDGEGRLVRLTDAKGNSSALRYDAKGRMAALTDSLGNTRTLTYDKTRNLTSVQDAYGRVIQSLSYDSRDNLVGITNALSNSSGLRYDELNRLKQSVDPLGRVIQMNHDALDRLVSTLNPLGGTAAQSFDEDGRLTEITDANGNRTVFAYDGNSRRTAETSAAGGTVKYTYNARDLLAGLTNGRGQERQFTYDALGRLTKMSDPDGVVSYTYDANSNVLTVSDADGIIRREYDALDRIIKHTDSRGNVIRYQYDAADNLTALTYPDGKQVQYGYDQADQLVSVTDWNGRRTSYAYDKEGRLILTTRPNGSTVTRVYSEAGLLLRQTDAKAGGEVIAQYEYSYDKVGNIVAEKATPAPEPVAVSPAVMSYGPANQLASYNGQPVAHDADGNMVRGPLNGKSAAYDFDSRNRLRRVGRTVYTYNAENQRIAVAEGGSETQYVINPNASLSQVLVQENQAGEKTYYVYGIGLIGQEKNGAYRSFHYDFRGSTVAMTDEAGKITHQYAYSPYGKVDVVQEEEFNPFRYVGQYGVMHEGNGLYYMRARYYQPELRRFLGEDPIWNKNLFAYVEGAPVNSIDPLGTFGVRVKNFKQYWYTTVTNKYDAQTGNNVDNMVSAFRQEGGKNLNQSCGPIALLAAYNYHRKGDIHYLLSQDHVKSRIDILYKRIGRAINTNSNTDSKDLVKMASNLNLNAKAMGGTTTKGYDYQKMQLDLLYGGPVITLMKGNSSFLRDNYQHWVVIYRATDNDVGFFDPWTGKIKYATKQEFEDKWAENNKAVSLSPRVP